jgi:serine/threonine protein kinase
MKPRVQPGFPCQYGKYQLLARIGHGGMAEVFRARLPGIAGFEKIVVIKRLLPHLVSDQNMVDMFVNEARIAAEVQHRNVVQIFELGQAETGEYFMAMEHVAGTDLRQILRAAAVNAMRVPAWFSVHAVAEILDGLAYAHELADEAGRRRNIVHRDVTPANIFVSYLGDIKLGDFGVAKDDSRSDLTRAGQLKGKVPYMSPEQLFGRDIDARTDVFAAGVVLWECLTQRRLFGGRPDIEAMNLICYGERKPPSFFATDVPPELDRIVLRALTADVNQRTACARTLRDELHEVMPKLRDRVLQTDVRSIVESLLGNRDPSAGTGPRSIHDEAVVKQNFFEPTPGTPSGHQGPPIPLPVIETYRNPLPRPASATISSGPPQEPLRPPPISPSPWTHRSVSSPSSPAAPPDTVVPEKAFPRSPSSTGRAPASAPPPRPPSSVSQPGSRWAAPMLDAAHAREIVPMGPPAQSSAPPRSNSIPEITDDLSRKRSRSLGPSADPSVLGEQLNPRVAPEIERSPTPVPRPLPSGIYQGPHPFWVHAHEMVIGPLSLMEATSILRTECQEGRIDDVRISGNQMTWMDAATFAILTGQEILVDRWSNRERELPRNAFSGTIPETPLVELLGRIAREHPSGRLIVANPSLGPHTRREIVIHEGRPTFVYANVVELQLPEQLVQKKLVTRDELAELVHTALIQDRALENLFVERMHVDLTPYWPAFMKDRLADLFRWKSARFALDVGSTVTHTTPFAPSFLALLPELVQRAKR